jgi:ribosome-binding factor A
MKPYRKEKVASLIQTVVSETIAYELHDPRIATVTTVTRVEVSGDLLQAKVYLSVLGPETEERLTLAAVRHAGGFIQRRVAGVVQLRHCPHLTFMLDEAAKTARETIRILDENRRLRGELDDLDAPSVTSLDPASPGTDPESLAGEEAGR